MDLLELLASVFNDYTLRNVALGAAVLGIVSGVTGSFAVLSKQSLLGDAMSHAALPGVVLAFLISGSKSPAILLLGAFITAWLGALLVMAVVNLTRLKQDSGLGIVLAVFFGLGLALLSWTQRNVDANQSGLDKYLFGRAAAIVRSDVIVMALVGLLALVLVVVFWKEFKMLVFDPEYAAAQGYPTSVLNGLLNTLIVIGIVVGLQMVGVVLMAAMVVAPASAARQWTDRLGLMVVLAAFFGALSGVGGAMISAAGRGLATGPVIVLFVTALVGISLLFAPNRGLLWDWLRQRRTRAELGRARVLEALYLLGLSHNNPIRPHPQRSLELALPALNVGQALETLAEEGAVVRQNGTQWALTEAGQARVVEHLRSTHSDSRRMLAQGDRA